MESKIKILEDKEYATQLYIRSVENTQFLIQRVWDSAKFFTTLTSALITANIALYSLLGGHGEVGSITECDNQMLSSCFLCAIPIIVVAVSIIGIANLRREYSNFLDCMIIVDKLQSHFGLYQKFENKKYLNDKYLFPQRISAKTYTCSEDFKKFNSKRKNTLYFYFKCLHIVYILIAILMIAVSVFG